MSWLKGRARLFLGMTAVSGSAFANPAAIDIKFADNPPSAVVRVVAEVGHPSTVTLTAATNLKDLISSRCGGVDPTYLAILTAQNPALKKLTSDIVPPGTILTLPACIRTQIPAAHVLKQGETVGSIFARNGFPIDLHGLEKSETLIAAASLLDRAREFLASGFTPRTDRGFRATQNAQTFVQANPFASYRDIKPGSEIVVPAAPGSATIALAKGITVEEATSKIQAATVPTGNSAKVTATGAKIASLISDVSLPLGSCSPTGNGWPFSPEVLRAALAENLQARPTNATVEPARVLVLDTGIANVAGWANALPPTAIAQMRGFDLRSGANRYVGVNLATSSNFADPPSDLPNRQHGAEVAAMILGGSQLTPIEKTALPIRLSFASVAATDRDNIPFLSEAAISRAFRQATNNRIFIINASLEAVDDVDQFQTALSETDETVLFVTAAGNDGSPFTSTSATWPGSFGGDPSNAPRSVVVTVGAHDITGAITPFSRRGYNKVDILAPGCTIGTYTSDDAYPAPNLKPIKRDGTSFAAPLVTMVAALLQSEGLSPPDIKKRLIFSADFDPTLSEDVYSSGRLNIAKALSVWRDYIAINDHGTTRTLRGQIQNRGTVLSICGTGYRIDDLGKFTASSVAGPPDGRQQVHVWLRSTNDKVPLAFTQRQCLKSDANTAGSLTFINSTDGRPLTLALSDVLDLVPRELDPSVD
ncbi:S8 family serine peptidase [Sphingomonas sp. PR090111-T3T-6A]|uniref:S8 family serine peptidase n=1 Tax=Sphingomonas sp. PR090111-T3T-6A TaxID=685778 RepID=UPI0003807682|nr:S8 family serine peptidase [Sphingomonas sp. PR090111-T3T-6A]